MKKHTAALSAAAVTVLSAAGAMKLNDALFRPEVPPPGEVDLPCRRLSVPSGDALLSGALLGEEGPRGRLLLAHGMGVSWDYYLSEIRRFVALGYQVLTFSYRGYPGSGGRFQGFPQAGNWLSFVCIFILLCFPGTICPAICYNSAIHTIKEESHE